jgi:tRNA(Ile)-lysidine synthase
MARPNGRLNPGLTNDVAEIVGSGHCVVALGGGADSAVLLAAAAQACDPANIRGLFVHHGLEGSDMLQKSAVAVCDMFAISVDVLEAEVADGPDLEARARDARYAVMEAVLSDAEIGLTAHTRDDQAETVLMHLVRGSGATGLRGIPKARGRWRRPFLDRTKSGLREIADDLGLPYTDDPANSDPRFTRTLVRNKILPLLEAEFDRPVTDGLSRTAALLADDDEALEGIADEIVLHGDTVRALIPKAPLEGLPLGLSRRVVRRGLRMVMDGYPGTYEDVSRVHVCLESGTSQQLTEGLFVVDLGPYLMVGTPPSEEEPLEVAVGEAFTWAGSRYTTRLQSEGPTMVDGGRFTVLDAAATGTSFVVRGWEPGDRIEIASGTNRASTPVSELLRDHGVPSILRPVSPIVTDDAKIAAVVGVRTAVWALPHSGEQRVVIERELLL